MPRNVRFRDRFFGTQEVAAYLGIPIWRVKNFSEGAAYNLPPSVQVGKGPGSRRIYSFADLCRLIVANDLVNSGLAPEDVGRAVHKIPESILLHEHEGSDEDLPVLVGIGRKWKVRPADEALEEIHEHLSGPMPAQLHTVTICNFLGLIENVFSRMHS